MFHTRRRSRKCSSNTSAFGALQSLETRVFLSASKVGGEIRVNTTVTNFQDGSDVAMNSSGAYVVVWESLQNGTDVDIYAQRFYAWGEKAGTSFRVNTIAAGNQTRAAVAISESGDFVVTWVGVQSGTSGSIYMRRFNASGVPQGVETVVDATHPGSQDLPDVAMDHAGNFVIVWQDLVGSGDADILGQRYLASGSKFGSRFRANSTTAGAQEFPAVAMGNNGMFTVTWASADEHAMGIYARRLYWSGGPIGQDFQVNTETIDNQVFPSIAEDPAGDFVIMWGSYGQDGDKYGVYAQRFGAAGTPQGLEFQVTTTTDEDQIGKGVAMSPTGEFIITWGSYTAATSTDIFAQRFTAGGMPVGNEFRVNTYTKDDQSNPHVGINGAGDFIITWDSENQDTSDYGIYGQLYANKMDFAGVQRGSTFYLDSNHSDNYDAGTSTADDILTTFGASGDKPVIGDWNKDGFDDIGVWRNGFFYLDANGNGIYDGATLDRYFSFGLTTDTPIAGDWNGDGKDEIGVWRAGKFYLDTNGDRIFNGSDATYTFGAATDTPLIGDWNGDGIDDIGVWRAGRFYLDLNGNHLWDRPDIDAVFSFGNPTDKPVVGDWNGDGRDKVGVRRTSQFWTDYNGNQKWDTADGPYIIDFGVSSDVPLIGFWRPRAVPGNPPAAPAGITIQAADANQISAPTATLVASQIDSEILSHPTKAKLRHQHVAKGK